MLNNNYRMIGLVGVLLLLGGIAFWTFSQPTTYPSADVGRNVADAFLKSLQSGQATEAWQSTTAEFKSAQGRESFLGFVKNHDFLTKPLEFSSSQLVEVQEQQRSEFVYRVPENKTTIRIVLGNDGGAWKVDRMAVH